jgi:polyisoprenoid-binding protein YceI
MRTLAAFLVLTISSAAQDQIVDSRRSTITIHVSKTGLLAALGHDHFVSAAIVSGEFNDKENPHVTLTVDARAMKVMPERDVSPKDQAQIQETMQRKVLESDKYPLIQFRSSSAAEAADRSWKIAGLLTLHGVARPVSVEAKRQGEAWAGSARIKQSDFGMQPVSVAGAVVKVKDELEIRFEIYTVSSASTAASRFE